MQLPFIKDEKGRNSYGVKCQLSFQSLFNVNSHFRVCSLFVAANVKQVRITEDRDLLCTCKVIFTFTGCL